MDYALETKTCDSVDSFNQWTDEELLIEYRMTQCREAFEVLVYRYERELFGFLRRFLGSVEKAEDAFQATFLQVHNNCESFDETRSFRTWLYTIARNKATDMYRQSKRRITFSLDEAYPINGSDGGDSRSFIDSIPSKSSQPFERMINDERVAGVREAVHRLPDILKQVLYKVYFEGMTYDEAARSLGIHLGTLRSRLNRAFKKLNSLLSAERMMD
ncbi:MAG: sigma-70 family RNA polymerase sigma factor [Planctomycetaceae bacterium]|jgi:RNA polymerase sigma-70 factor (ECF subfamily)|nr:sigma-70 family RNA polymerase sigma factor [Planctomycetaceae bacterium]